MRASISFFEIGAFPILVFTFKDKVEFWSCDCMVKEKVWNGSEKVYHVACKVFVCTGTARFWNHQNNKKLAQPW